MFRQPARRACRPWRWLNLVQFAYQYFNFRAVNSRIATFLPILCAAACIAIAAVSVLGWLLDAEVLMSGAPGLPKMVPMTAFLMVLAGVSILRQARGGAGRRLGASIAAGALAILVLRTLLGHGRGVVLYTATGSIQLSSPLTAILFALTGAGLWCIGGRSRVGVGQWLALGALQLSVLTMAGYAFRGTFLYDVLPGQGTSVLTTSTFILASIAILALRPRDGIMAAMTGPGTSAQAARRLLLSSLAVPLLVGALCALALDAGWVDVNAAMTLLVWGMIAMFTAVVWRVAVRLYRIDAARQAAERAREDAMARLREADAHKDDFLALIAHELRNPLAPIRAAAELMRLTAATDPAQVRRASDIVLRQVGHMAHLVDDLLDLSSVSRGLITLQRAPVDLCAAVGDALEQARPQMAERHHVLTTDLDAARPRVHGDHKRLVQVVANLLGNAAKYTPDGGRIRLTLRVRAHAAEVSVEDDGIGIDPDLLPRLFEPFTQGKRGTGRVEGGLGLGLALVKRLVELHGGTIDAYSGGPGKGSRFVLTLPTIGAQPA
jgi:signal transduction histidine kinase